MRTDSEHLYQLIGQKLERLEQLYACSSNQMQYLEMEEMGAILEILAEKQHLLIAIEGIDRQIAQYHVDDPEERVWPSPEMRQECRDRVSRCDQLIRETLECDRMAEQRLIDKKNDAKSRLLQFSDTAHVQGVYRRQKTQTTPPPAVVRIDLGSG
ncbi:MAG: hypothetical protein FWD31_10370 [Planctomycetaceae bacterium]|nr:hypothetical protein [Planctomycetaceae bacterium]